MSEKLKIKKVAKMAKIISIVLFCIYILTAVILLALAIMFRLSNTLRELLVKMQVKDNVFIEYFVTQAFASVLVFFFIKLFHTIQLEETPFCLNVVQSLKRISIFILVEATVKNFFTSLVAGAFSGDLHISFQLTFEANSFIIGIALLLVSIIFEYGIKLQKQDDETL